MTDYAYMFEKVGVRLEISDNMLLDARPLSLFDPTGERLDGWMRAVEARGLWFDAGRNRNPFPEMLTTPRLDLVVDRAQAIRRRLELAVDVLRHGRPEAGDEWAL